MVSRRAWIGRFLTLAGLAAFAQYGRAAETPAKISKDAAKYQDQPHNGQTCGMCKFYIPPDGRAGSGMMGGPGGPSMMGRGMMGGHMGPGMMGAGTCQLVEGVISPMGWCALYQPLSD
jgi:hypothetical protein